MFSTTQIFYRLFQVIKLFGENYLSSTTDLCHLSRDSTIDSVELIRNYIMAPSYSEALLVERFPLRADTLDIENELSDELNSSKASKSLVNRASNRMRNSFSRTSLRNGQILYLVSPIISNSGESATRMLPNINNEANNEIIENPPDYEEVLLESHPLQDSIISHLNPLRRSVTDRDFLGRLTDRFRRQWSSYIDIQFNLNETQI